MNSSKLNEVCDYAFSAGMRISVYFSAFLSYNDLGETIISTTFPNGTYIPYDLGYQSPLPIGWLKNVTTRHGNCFLGAYVFDEPEEAN